VTEPAVARLLRAGAAGLGALPPRAAYAVADAGALGVLGWTALHERRVAPRGRGLARNQRIVYREALDAARPRRLRRAWARHLGRLVADLARLGRLAPEALAERLDLAALECLRPQLADGRGLIAVSGHIGVWELLAQLPALTELRLTIAARPAASAALDAWLRELRSRGGARVVPQRGALRQLTQALRRGEVVGLLADEDRARRAVFAPFLGTPAATSPACARLQQRTGAPIAVVTCQRSGIGRFRFDVWDVIEGGDTRSICERVNRALSRAIRTHPEQWLWGSRRFHTRPAGERPGPDGLPPRAGG
jgi:KDO2-lipid IV(A) lauroyltransferase